MVRPVRLGGRRREPFEPRGQTRYKGSLFSARSMSTKYADDHNLKPTISCKVCNGQYVPGGVRIKLPDHVCLWCFTRSSGAAYRRFTLLWQGLEALAQTHDSECDCKGCKIFRLALPIMNPTAIVPTSEDKP